MSLLTGLYAANGQIPTNPGAPTIFWRGVGWFSSAALAVTGNAPTTFIDGVGVDATGAVCHSTVNAIAGYSNGVPVDAAGRLCTVVAAPTAFDQGVGYNGGRVCIS